MIFVIASEDKMSKCLYFLFFNFMCIYVLKPIHTKTDNYKNNYKYMSIHTTGL